MPKAEQFVGRWVAWKDDLRFEQELYPDGKFEAIVFDEEDSICHCAIGTWQVEDGSIIWRYLKGGPKYVDKNELLSVGKNQFSVRERDGARTDFYRGFKGSMETSANFDLVEVAPFLKRISALFGAGFGAAHVRRVVRETRKLKREQSRQYVFPIRFEGAAALLGVRVVMDDLEAPDLYFYAPLKLMLAIDKEIEKLDAGS